MNETTIMNKSANVSVSDEDYFAKMFEPVQNKIVFTLVYFIVEVFGTSAVLVILAHDASRTDLKRTLINSISNTFFLSQVL